MKVLEELWRVRNWPTGREKENPARGGGVIYRGASYAEAKAVLDRKAHAKLVGSE